MSSYSDDYKDMQYAAAVEQSKAVERVPAHFRPLEDYQEVQKRDLLVKVVQSNGFSKSFVMSVHRIDGRNFSFVVYGRVEGCAYDIVMECEARRHSTPRAVVKRWPVVEEVAETAATR